jgi:glutathione synthase/RimK-type ligase-like ATP-grasp enzyme
MIRAFWLLSVMVVCACDKEVPYVDDPNNIVIAGEKMDTTAFLEKYCIGKEENPICSKVLNAATKNLLDKARVPTI